MSDTPDSGTPEPMREVWMPPDAPKPGVIPLRSLGLGEVLGGAFATIRRYPALLLGSAAVVLTVSSALSLYLMVPVLDDYQRLAAAGPLTSMDEVQSIFWRIMSATAAGGVVGVLGQVFLTGLVTIVAGRAVVGKPITLGQAWTELRPRILPLLGTTLLIGVCVVVGIVLCVLPGIWIAVLFSLATPALVLEGLTVRQAFTRSKELVRGAWWSTFGFLVAAVAISWVVNLVLSLPFGGSGFGAAFSGQYAPTTAQFVTTMIVGLIGSVVTYPFISTVTALVYIDRRIIVERLDVQLAQAAERP
jgi:hypothetical protein